MRSDEDILTDLNNADIDDVLVENMPSLCIKHTRMFYEPIHMFYNKTNNVYKFKNNSLTTNELILSTNTYIDKKKYYITVGRILVSIDSTMYDDLLKFINNGFQLDVVSNWLFAGTLK